MITHYLGEQEIVAYSRDLAKRLLALGNATPTLWVAVGTSGFKMAQRVLPLLPRELIDQIEVATVHFDRKNDAVKFVGFEASELPISADRPVFVIDSAVHSGRSLLAVIRAIRDLGATNVMSYSLVLKLGSIICKKVTALENILDEISGVYLKTIYKLENLH